MSSTKTTNKPGAKKAADDKSSRAGAPKSTAKAGTADRDKKAPEEAPAAPAAPKVVQEAVSLIDEKKKRPRPASTLENKPFAQIPISKLLEPEAPKPVAPPAPVAEPAVPVVEAAAPAPAAPEAPDAQHHTQRYADDSGYTGRDRRHLERDPDDVHQVRIAVDDQVPGLREGLRPVAHRVGLGAVGVGVLQGDADGEFRAELGTT